MRPETRPESGFWFLVITFLQEQISNFSKQSTILSYSLWSLQTTRLPEHGSISTSSVVIRGCWSTIWFLLAGVQAKLLFSQLQMPIKSLLEVAIECSQILRIGMDVLCERIPSVGPSHRLVKKLHSLKLKNSQNAKFCQIYKQVLI